MRLPEDVAAAIAEQRDALAELCRDLVRLPTPNPPGDGYGRLVEFLSQWFSRAGIESRLIRVPDGELSALLPDGCRGPRAFVEATLHGKAPGPTLYLQGHYDTIPPTSGWTTPPFGAATDGETIWGLGASDMKGGLASMMMAMKALRAVGGPPRGKIVFLATPDEEYASGANIRYLFSKGMVAGAWAIVGEFSGVQNLFVGMKGGIWGDLVATGKAAHGSQPGKGVNAFEKLARAAIEIEDRFKPVLRTRKSTHPFVPPEYDSPTVMLGGIVRGSNLARSAVPDSASVSFDLRTIPEDSGHRLLEDLRGFLAGLRDQFGDLDLEVKVASQFPTYAVPHDSPLVQALQGSIAEVTGAPPSLSISCAATEAAFFAQAGIPAIAYGPGLWQAAHAKDEHVRIGDLATATRVYARAAWLLLAGEGPMVIPRKEGLL